MLKFLVGIVSQTAPSCHDEKWRTWIAGTIRRIGLHSEVRWHYSIHHRVHFACCLHEVEAAEVLRDAPLLVSFPQSFSASFAQKPNLLTRRTSNFEPSSFFFIVVVVSSTCVLCRNNNNNNNNNISILYGKCNSRRQLMKTLKICLQVLMNWSVNLVRNVSQPRISEKKWYIRHFKTEFTLNKVYGKSRSKAVCSQTICAIFECAIMELCPKLQFSQWRVSYNSSVMSWYEGIRKLWKSSRGI